MNTINALLAAIPPNKSVRIELPLLDSNIKLRLPCVFQPDAGSSFRLLFPENDLEHSRIDIHRKGTVIVDLAGQNISLAVDIDAIENERTMRLTAQNFINHASVRDYFRVDVRTPLAISSLMPAAISGQDEWKLTGETVDLSGAGLLAELPESVELNKRLRLNLLLPTGDGTLVPIVVRAIRTHKLDEHLYHTAFRFDQIAEEDQDKIMASCFEIQRRLLRLKA